MPDPEVHATSSPEESCEPVLTPAVLRDWPLPSSAGGKESRGRVLVVGGNVAMPGAVLLAAEAALRGGAGKLQVATPEPVAVPMAMHLPEAMVAGLPTDGAGDIAASAADEIVELASGCAAVLLGPGIGSPEAAVALLSAVVPRLDVPVVIDALGMAYLTEHPDGVAHLSGRAVLSPNMQELARTLGEEDEACEDDPRAAIQRLASRSKAVVASGGSLTWIATPEGRIWRDESGGPGLGVSGSGDVKAGAIAGLLARGATPAQAACWATYAHGRAGERLSAQVGTSGFLARELLRQIPAVLAELA
ncbi:NAD(P)H-hydrate dehydratase [Mobilicoccus massiliensis]|uniref:NAD(P)H-hydrate dehydratase n=1 Tax=Mobilicoccus massiliensis TaxID=1522310 RepID=UPI0006933EA6|nr:NAD(P)H-hydrate dehydratase [Mobilicoccus massiliensis]